MAAAQMVARSLHTAMVDEPKTNASDSEIYADSIENCKVNSTFHYTFPSA